MAFARRVGNEPLGQWVEACRWLANVLRVIPPPHRLGAEPIDGYADDPAVFSTPPPRDRRRHFDDPAP